MNKVIRLSLLLMVAIGIGGGVALRAAAAPPPNQANRLEATFVETNKSITNRISDLGLIQLINVGSGTVEGLGSATVVVGITQDRSVMPCGAGSWTNTATRRIVLPGKGVLAETEVAMACPTASGIVISGTYTIDGLASTGIFAGATGSGNVTVNPATRTSQLSGKLKLAR